MGLDGKARAPAEQEVTAAAVWSAPPALTEAFTAPAAAADRRQAAAISRGTAVGAAAASDAAADERGICAVARDATATVADRSPRFSTNIRGKTRAPAQQEVTAAAASADPTAVGPGACAAVRTPSGAATARVADRSPRVSTGQVRAAAASAASAPTGAVTAPAATASRRRAAAASSETADGPGTSAAVRYPSAATSAPVALCSPRLSTGFGAKITGTAEQQRNAAAAEPSQQLRQGTQLRQRQQQTGQGSMQPRQALQDPQPHHTQQQGIAAAQLQSQVQQLRRQGCLLLLLPV